MSRRELLVLEFLVRTFALLGDVESCLALRHEALLLRDLKSTTHEWLKVPHLEWLNFAQQLLDNGFYSIAAKACENKILSLKRKSAEQPTQDGVCLGRSATEDPKTDKVFSKDNETERMCHGICFFSLSSDANSGLHEKETQTEEYGLLSSSQEDNMCSEHFVQKWNKKAESTKIE